MSDLGWVDSRIENATKACREENERLRDDNAHMRSMLSRIRDCGGQGIWAGEDCAIGAIAVLEGEEAARRFMRERDIDENSRNI